MRSVRRRPGQQYGFGYLLLLFAIAVLGIVLASLGQSWSATRQRERESELLFIASQFSQALESYRARTPVDQPDKPPSLKELVEDTRFPMPVRHLRQIYRDPMTGDRNWDLVVQDGRIVGIRSRSNKPALRVTLPEYIKTPVDAAEAMSYHDWLITAPPASTNKVEK